MSYYNTNKETGQTLFHSRAKAESQKDFIKRNFLLSGEPFKTAEQIHWSFNQETPLTSIRRAMSDLVTEGFLIKTDKMKVGKYGKSIHYYKRA